MALERDHEPTGVISIEKLDDIAFEVVAPQGDQSAAELFQLKHHVRRPGGTTNSSLDVWKTLKIWCDAVLSDKIDLASCRLLLITTSTAATTHAISKLRPCVADRDTEQARKTLEAAGKRSTNDTVSDCFKSLKKLKAADRKTLFSSIFLLEGSPNILEVRAKLERAIWKAVNADKASAFVDRLEGWWFGSVIQHLSDDSSHRIGVEAIHNQVHHLREQFKRDNLPPDLLLENVPDMENPEDDSRTFVKQLLLVAISQGRIRKAQENHYRAVAQRSRWIRSNLIDLNEWDEFELRLINEWSEFYEMMVDDLDDDSDDEDIKKAGNELYKWAHQAAAGTVSLFIRPQFQSPYLTRGSYHMLADQLRIGWHRDFKDRFDETGAT